MTVPPGSPNPQFTKKYSVGPHGPAGVILRAEDVPFWTDGKSYLDATKIVLDQARRECTEAIQSERQKGYEDGLQSGSNDAIVLIAQTKGAIDKYHQTLSGSLTELVIQTVKEVLGDIDPADAVVLSVRKALKSLNLTPDVTLFVSPAVVNKVRERLALDGDHDGAPLLPIVEDAKLAPNSCRLVSEFGTIDLSIDKQIAILAQSFRAAGVGPGNVSFG